LLILLISLPVQVAARSHDALSWWSAPGIVLFAFGLTFEAIGDEQLRRFKADPANAHRVLDTGLWHYTRHPNYFGEFCVWWGMWLLALPTPGTWWTFVAPAVLTSLLLRVSGVGRQEQNIGERRPEYARYAGTTPSFIPFPRPRR
jgi:steroid 5-alpha reductase family enzyme